jgi:excinuclease ABC subunit C
MEAFIVQYYAERTLPETVLLPVRLTDEDVQDWLENEGVTTEVPGTGRHRKLVELAMKNARTRPDTKDNLAELADRLSLQSVERIEGFDVSHSQGKAVVGSNVLFVEGESKPEGYRRKKLIEQNDDYDNMYELVRWRATRAIEGRDARSDPDLLLIDGGQGQLNAARDALADVGWDVPAIGLAKDEEIVVTVEREYDWNSDAGYLQVLQQVRDEAHRFAVQYHQSLRDDVTTMLDAIDGIGPKTRQKLLRRFGGIDQIREAPIEELQDIEGVGEATAETIQSSLQG